MKLSLSVKITIKNYLPKYKTIPYDNFVCLIKHNNNFISQIKLSNLHEQNFITHKVESINSNIIYKFHIFDTIKRSLIGISHLCINFDKVKNLNINDTLTQEGNYKLIIDSITKRKFFDNITNMGDIFLVLVTEVKILNKTLYEPNKGKNKLYSINNENNAKNNNINNNDLNLTPKTFKKKQIIKTMKSDYESLNLLDTFNDKSEFNTNTNIFKENDFNTFYQGTVTKKNKSTNKAKINLKNIIKYNNNKIYNFNNSYVELMSPKNNHINYSKRKNKNKNSKNKKKVSILNLLEQKVDKTKYKESIDNFIESNMQSCTLYNFNKIRKDNNIKNIKKKDYNTFNYFNKLSCDKKEKNYRKSFCEQDFFRKKNINTIKINLCGNNEISTERKLKSKKRVNNFDYNKLNTEIINNNNIIFNNKNASININNINNNIFLQTEVLSSTAQKLPEKKKSLNKNILNNLNIKKLSTNKDKFKNIKSLEQTRGTFSPKLSLKIKLDENVLLTETNDNIKTRNKEKINKKVMTPKGNKIKYIAISFTNEKNQEQINEELRQKFFGIFDCYSLLMKKIKNNYENNKEFQKKYDEIKERYNHLNKLKNKISDLKEENESKKIINHTYTHFEEEKLLTKMKSIKLKENSINDFIFGDIEKNTSTINKINELITQKKSTLLNLTKNIVKYYGNISQIYNEDNDKKMKLIKILDKYDIKEKNKTNLNYINYINKANNFNDKVITEVDEEKENEEECEESSKNHKNLILDDDSLLNNNYIFTDDENNIKEIKISIPNLNGSNKKVKDITTDEELNYDENLNNLIEKILIEQFPENYKTSSKFVHLEKNKFQFKNNIFFAYIEDNDVILKDEYNGYKYTLNEFYDKFCAEEKKENKLNFIYTKKIRQKYIRIKSYDEKENINDKKIKNENSTTMDTDFIQQSMISKGNEVSEEKI